jgi:hypothetical protein
LKNQDAARTAAVGVAPRKNKIRISVAEKLISLRRIKLLPQRVDAVQEGRAIEMKSVYREHLPGTLI